MNCDTYACGSTRSVAREVRTAERTGFAVTGAMVTYTTGRLVPGQVSSYGKTRKEESGSDVSLKLHCDEGQLN